LAKINIVGVGPGSADYVTPIARKTVQQAQVVFGAKRSLNLFPSDIKGEVFVLTAKNLTDSLKHAAESVKSGKNVALLSTGDPGFSGLLHTVLECGLFTTQQVNVVAGVSSIQVCAATLNISWDKACLFTFHEGNVTDETKNQLVQCLKEGKDTMLLPDSKSFSAKEIASFLIKAGLHQKTSVYICENLTLENEKITSSTLEEVTGQTFGSLCVMVIKANTK
jgi:cobalt-precorrin-7 (C5)-methyltransferase